MCLNISDSLLVLSFKNKLREYNNELILLSACHLTHMYIHMYAYHYDMVISR